MKINVTEYKWEKVKKDNVEYTLPDKTTYWFQTGIRRSIKIIPVWTTWKKEHENKPEEIWQYIFIMVYLSFECRVERVEVQISNIEHLLSRDEESNSNPLLAYLRNKLDPRTKNDFEADFELALDKLKI